eukprot:907822-Rhodomonas_salina.1
MLDDFQLEGILPPGIHHQEPSARPRTGGSGRGDMETHPPLLGHRGRNPGQHKLSCCHPNGHSSREEAHTPPQTPAQRGVVDGR